MVQFFSLLGQLFNCLRMLHTALRCIVACLKKSIKFYLSTMKTILKNCISLPPWRSLSSPRCWRSCHPQGSPSCLPNSTYLYLDFNLLRITSPASNLSKIPRVEFMTLKLFSNWTIRSKTLERKKKLTGISGFSFSLNWDTCNKEGDPCSNTGSLSTSFVKGVNLCFMKSKFKPIFTYMTSLLYEWVTPMKFNYIKILDIV